MTTCFCRTAESRKPRWNEESKEWCEILSGVVQRRCGGYSALYDRQALGRRAHAPLGEERLDDYMNRLVDFMDSLDKEPREMFIPFVADMAAAHATDLGEFKR